MTPQEIFNTVATGIIKQGGPSVDEYGNCFYRGQDGRKCAGGFLIPDDQYDPSMEGLTFCAPDETGTTLPGWFWPDNTNDKLAVIRDLQQAHDRASASRERDPKAFFLEWKPAMEKVAADHLLDISVLHAS